MSEACKSVCACLIMLPMVAVWPLLLFRNSDKFGSVCVLSAIVPPPATTILTALLIFLHEIVELQH